MRSCRDLDPLVTPYVDGELPDTDRRAVDDHLRVCAPCHSRIAAERAVHELVRTRRADLCALETTTAPDALRTRCARTAREAALQHLAPGTAPGTAAPRTAPSTPALRTPAPRAWISRATPWALAASLVLVVGGAFLYQATDASSRVLAAELTADHVKCFALNSAFGTHHTAATVEASMLSGFGWRVHLPEEVSRAGLELVGSRPCLYGEGKIAHIMYRHRGEPVSLFMLPRTARAQEFVEVLGHEAAIWCAGNRTFVLVSREPRREVERMAALVQASLR
ncbi:MAG: zf-HC2 domain-containing protein [Acidobacteria bacterium]|nr:zf-HC2 domain-containing protein [Acidobacteriota bacterium]